MQYMMRTSGVKVDEWERSGRNKLWIGELAQVYGSTEQLLGCKVDAVVTSVPDCRAKRKVSQMDGIRQIHGVLFCRTLQSEPRL